MSYTYWYNISKLNFNLRVWESQRSLFRFLKCFNRVAQNKLVGVGKTLRLSVRLSDPCKLAFLVRVVLFSVVGLWFIRVWTRKRVQAKRSRNVDFAHSKTAHQFRISPGIIHFSYLSGLLRNQCSWPNGSATPVMTSPKKSVHSNYRINRQYLPTVFSNKQWLRNALWPIGKAYFGNR